MNLRTLLDRLDAIDHKSTLKEEWQPNPRQKDWLGNADASDPYIINRMPDALGPKPEKDSKGLPQSGNTTSSRSERRRDSDSAPAGAEIRSRPTRLAANDPRRTNYQVIGGKIPAGDNIPDDADDEWDGRVFYGDTEAPTDQSEKPQQQSRERVPPVNAAPNKPEKPAVDQGPKPEPEPETEPTPETPPASPTEKPTEKPTEPSKPDENAEGVSPEIQKAIDEIKAELSTIKESHYISKSLIESFGYVYEGTRNIQLNEGVISSLWNTITQGISFVKRHFSGFRGAIKGSQISVAIGFVYDLFKIFISGLMSGKSTQDMMPEFAKAADEASALAIANSVGAILGAILGMIVGFFLQLPGTAFIFAWIGGSYSQELLGDDLKGSFVAIYNAAQGDVTELKAKFQQLALKYKDYIPDEILALFNENATPEESQKTEKMQKLQKLRNKIEILLYSVTKPADKKALESIKQLIDEKLAAQ